MVSDRPPGLDRSPAKVRRLCRNARHQPGPLHYEDQPRKDNVPGEEPFDRGKSSININVSGHSFHGDNRVGSNSKAEVGGNSHQSVHVGTFSARIFQTLRGSENWD